MIKMGLGLGLGLVLVVMMMETFNQNVVTQQEQKRRL